MNKEAIEVQRNKIEEEIIKLGYESLRFSLLECENQNRSEWQWRIDFENGKYFVYGLADRASIYGKKQEFSDFEPAKQMFMNKLKSTVDYNQWAVKNNMSTGYSSPLWDNYDSEN